MKKLFFLLTAILLFHIPAAFALIHIVAAENFYGDVAKEIGGNRVSVMSILQNPEQDPHLFTTSPSVAKAVADADIVIYNGANYDDWMVKLLSVPANKPRQVILVADCIGAAAKQNPHIWYNLQTMTNFAQVLTTHLNELDPAFNQDYHTRLQNFASKQQALQAYVQQLHDKFHGLTVTATEPVFNLMADALGLQMNDQDFQWSVENEGSPSPEEVRTMMEDLKAHKSRALIYNVQVTSALIDQVKAVAQQSNVPVVGVSETQPPGMNYDQWMRSQLAQLAKALSP